MKKGQSKPGVKFSKVNRVQSEDGGGDDARDTKSGKGGGGLFEEVAAGRHVKN
jgi:hypothetical protein